MALKELTPEYLQRIPFDPFASDAGAIGWIAFPRPILFSVGENARDDGVAAHLGATSEPPDPWKEPDAAFLLRRTAKQGPKG